MIDIKALNRKELLAYVESDQFGLGEDIAISRHRAKSQAINPRLDENDILMILALEEGTLVGYLGILPDQLFSPNEKQKIGWFSCLWVSPKARGKSISTLLMKSALEHWDYKILSADYVPFTKKIYDKTKAFGKLPYTKTGLRFYLRSDLYNLLPPKVKFFQNIKEILKIKDAFFNVFFDLKLRFFKINIDQYKIKYIDTIDENLNQFLSENSQRFGFNRTAKELNWILENPWILNKEKDDGLSEKYHFSSIANDFQFKPLLIKNQENKTIALLIFAKRDGALKLPYLFYQENINAVADVVNHLLIAWKIKTFTCFHPKLCEALKRKPSPAFHSKIQERSYMVSTGLESIVFDKNTFVQDGDGDCCFT